MNLKRNNLIGALSLVLFLSASCSTNESGERSENFGTIASFGAHYDPATNSVTLELVGDGYQSLNREPSSFALTYDDTTGFPGVPGSSIEDRTYPEYPTIGYKFRYLGLVTPYTCDPEYNEATKTLSFGVDLINFTSNTYYNELCAGGNCSDSGVGCAGAACDGLPRYNFINGAADHDITFLAPFYFKLWYLDSTIVTAINTNLPSAECGASGLTLANDDNDPTTGGDGLFDCIFPNQPGDATGEFDPGWDFTPFVTNGDMTPGETLGGCQAFMQFTLTENSGFDFFFDMQAIRDDGTLPPIPNVTSPADGSYFNTNPITVSGNACNTGATVYVEGGASLASGACVGGSFSVSVPLNMNSLNALNIYQIDGTKQSGSTGLAVTHDNIAPQVIGSVPADGETAVDRNTNCTLTFSESMDPATLTAIELAFTDEGNGGDQTGTITPSATGIQVTIEPANKPLRGFRSYSCSITTGATDLAGNALAAAYSAQFTTAGGGNFFQDKAAPYVTGMNPADNQPDVPISTIFTVGFNEAIDPTTIVGNVVDGNCTNGSVPNVALFEMDSCNPGSAVPIAGSTSLNGTQDLAIFAPNNPGDITVGNCYGFAVSACVTDLSGNALANRGTVAIDSYGGDSLDYNTYHIFSTVTADVTVPKVVHVSPSAGSTGVNPSIQPFVVFDEAISPTSINGNNFSLTEFGDPTKISSLLQSDSTGQVIEIQPLLDLSNDTGHLLTIGLVQDLSGNTMNPPATTNFTTAILADSTSPTVISVDPDDGDNVNTRCPYIDIHFSEPMNESTLNAGNLDLANDFLPWLLTKPFDIQVMNEGMFVRIVPNSSFSTGFFNDWELTISANVQDRAGNTLGADDVRVIHIFADNTNPTVTSVVPAAGGSIHQNGNVLVFFSEPMDQTTLTSGNFPITGCTPLISTDPFGTYVVANCPDPLPTGNRQITINRNVRDFYNTRNNQDCATGRGNRMSGNVNSNFTVLAGDDLTAPTVSNLTDVSPRDGSTSVSTTIAPSVTFSEAIDPRTVSASSFFLVDETGIKVDAEISFSADTETITLTPASALSNPGIYYLIGTSAIRDLGGGNAYDGAGGESVEIGGVLRTCFSTSAAACP